MSKAKDIKRIEDLVPDSQNANKGTERGVYAVEESIKKLGAGRSIVVDQSGRVIAGNKTLQAAVDSGLDVIVVRTTGDKLVVVQREDLDLNDDHGMARQLAYADNRASEVGLAWDAEQILLDINKGVDLSDWFMDGEIEGIVAQITPSEFPAYDESIADNIIVGHIFKLRVTDDDLSSIKSELEALQIKYPNLKIEASTKGVI